MNTKKTKRADGTAVEVRKAALMPWGRDLLATSLRDVRRIYGGNLRKAEAADRRRSALRWDSSEKPADLYIPAHGCTPALLIRARAAARLMNRPLADFVADALAFAVDAAIDTTDGAGLPYTRNERAALNRLGESPEEYETDFQACYRLIRSLDAVNHK